MIFPRIVQSGFFLVGARNEAKPKAIFIYHPTKTHMSTTLEEKTKRGQKTKFVWNIKFQTFWTIMWLYHKVQFWVLLLLRLYFNN